MLDHHPPITDEDGDRDEWNDEEGDCPTCHIDPCECSEESPNAWKFR